MKISKKIAILPFVLFMSGMVLAQNARIAEEELKVLFKPQIARILENYQVCSQFTIYGDKIEPLYVSQFLDLFFPTDEKVIFNDLKFYGISAEAFFTPKEYVDFVKANYPFGLDISLFDLKNIEILRALEKKDNYILTVKITKKISGVYRSEKIYKNSSVIYFTFMASMADTLAGNSKGLKISNINNVYGYNKYIANNKMTGLYMGITSGLGNIGFGPGNSGLIHPFSLWKSTGQISYLKSIELSYMFSRGFGLGTGIKISDFKTNYLFDLPKNYRLEAIQDPDYDFYQPEISTINLQELDKIRCIDIPLLLKFRTGMAKTGVYLDIGLVYSLFSSSSYTLEGQLNRKGYYSQYLVTLENIPYDGYDFETFTYSKGKNSESLKTPAYGLSGFGAIGLSFPIKKILILKIGSNFNYSLMDIPVSYANHWILTDKQYPLKMQSMSLEIGLSYKLTNRYNF